MGVNWAAGLIRWHPHVRRTGERLSLSHLHPFRFDTSLEPEPGKAARLVSIYVGFSSHVFTCDAENANAASELYSDNRETRAFDEERYAWSFRLKGTVTELGNRKCYFARQDHFVTFEPHHLEAELEYRVFFTMRRRDSSSLDLIVQSAYVAKKDLSRHGLGKKPIRFCVIATKVLAGRAVVEAR
jgi:hypothetical protein